MAASFHGELTITQLSGKPGAWRLWRLEQALLFDIERPVNDLDLSKTIEVPVGFITDGPSIPRFLWVLLPVWGSWGRAGVVHDYLCCLIAMGVPHRDALTRSDADRVFNLAMGSLGVGTIARTLLYLGVKVGTLLRVKTTMVGFNAKLRAAQQAISS